MVRGPSSQFSPEDTARFRSLRVNVSMDASSGMQLRKLFSGICGVIEV
jgi:hypothetical protein